MWVNGKTEETYLWHQHVCEFDSFEHNGVSRVDLPLLWFKPFHLLSGQ